MFMYVDVKQSANVAKWELKEEVRVLVEHLIVIKLAKSTRQSTHMFRKRNHSYQPYSTK